jgi:AAA domain
VTSISVATGKELLREKVWGSNLRVLFINGEDSGIEIARRVWASWLAHADKTAGQTLDRLYVAGADDARVQRLSFLRSTDKNLSMLDRNGFEVLESALDTLHPDVLILDPLVAFCGGGNMNDNAVMSLVMRELKRLATKFDCAVLIVHHTRKGGDRGDAEAVSGAAAIVNLARRAIMPVPMTETDAKSFGVLPSERFRYFKLVDAKSNLAPRSADSPWYELHSVELPNPEPPIYPHGDNVQAVARITLPLMKTASAVADDRKLQRAILDLVDRGKVLDGEPHPYSPNVTGAQNKRALLDDVMGAVANATAPRQWLPEDLRAVVHGAIDKMKAEGWLYEDKIPKGRFRGTLALLVDWEKTPWSKANTDSSAAADTAMPEQEGDDLDSGAMGE